MRHPDHDQLPAGRQVARRVVIDLDRADGDKDRVGTATGDWAATSRHGLALGGENAVGGTELAGGRQLFVGHVDRDDPRAPAMRAP